MARVTRRTSELGSAREHGRVKVGDCELCEATGVVLGATYELEGVPACFECIVKAARAAGWV